MMILAWPKVGDRVRLALHYGGAWRPLAWFRVGKDGSIYLGLLLGRPETAFEASKPAAKQVTIENRELQPVPVVPSSSRVSFKASGEIHLGDRVLRGHALDSLSRPRQLCLMRFVHPSRYVPLRTTKANECDVRIEDYQVDESRPMYGALIVSPLGLSPLTHHRLPNMTASVSLAFGFRELFRTADLVVEVVIGHGPEGPWPALPGVGVAANSDGAKVRPNSAMEPTAL